MKRIIITDKEAKEAGVSKEVFQDWSDLMQAFWTAAITFYERNSTDKKEQLFPTQGENEIKIGDRFVINANMVNNSYVQANLIDKG